MDALTLLLQEQVPLAARGDREAFGRLVDATRSVVSSIALAIVRDVELSRDVSQDVFLAAWRDLGQLRDPGSFMPWLRQMTRHRAYHVLRTSRRYERRVTHADVDAAIDAAVDPRPPVDADLAASEERALLGTILDELPDETRDVVTLFYREGRSTSQVAALLGLSEPAVRKRLSRARARLRASLLERFGEAARRSAPGAGFSGAVLTAITIGAPVHASVAAAGTPAAAGAGASLASKLLALGGWLLLPVAGGLAGVLLGTRQLKRQARFVRELRQLRQFEAVGAALVIAAGIGFPVSWLLTESPWSQVATFAGFLIGLALLYGWWLPRILAPRFAAEAAEDVERARRARAQERRWAIVGWTLGIGLGTAGLIVGLLIR